MPSAGYIRVSTDEQAREGVSLVAQRAAILERSPDARIFEDVLSGARVDRPAYQEMLAAAASGEFAELYVWKFDRLGRDAEEMLRARKMLAAVEVSIVSLTEGDAESTLLYGVHAIMGQVEREKISERTRLGLRAIAAAGRAAGGQPPLGYHAEGERKNRRWIIADPEAAIVRRIFALYVNGDGQNKIVATLNAEGIRTRKGAQFSARVVCDLLRNPAYIGLVRFKDETFEGAHEPIIARETWDAAVRLREARRAAPNAGRGRTPVGRHLLVRGLLRCPRCGSGMSARSTAAKSGVRGPSEFYICSRRHSYGKIACDAPRLARTRVDRCLLTFFESVTLDVDGTVAAMTADAERRVQDSQALAGQAEREAVKVEESLARIRADYEAGELDASDWLEFRDDLGARLTAARAETMRHRDQAARIASEVAALDARSELALRLTEARLTVAGKIASTESLEALRAVLTGAFSRVEVKEHEHGFALLPRGAHGSDGGEIRAVMPISGREVTAPWPTSWSEAVWGEIPLTVEANVA